MNSEPVLAALREMIDKALIELQGVTQQIEALKIQRRDLQRECDTLAQQLAEAPAIIAEAKKAAAFIYQCDEIFSKGLHGTIHA